VINWFLGTSVGRWSAIALAAVVLMAGVAVRFYLRGKDAARAEAVEKAFRQVATGIKARADERRNPTDPKHDPNNRDNWPSSYR
jgi:hypothetical protein